MTDTNDAVEAWINYRPEKEMIYTKETAAIMRHAFMAGHQAALSHTNTSGAQCEICKGTEGGVDPETGCFHECPCVNTSEGVVIDLDKSAFAQLCKAAAESKWIPEEYFQNDWVSDCCDFLINGPPTPDTSLHKTQTSPDDELVEAVQTAIDEWFAGDMKFRQQPIGQFVAQSILPLLASREAAVLAELDKTISEIAILSNPDWEAARIGPIAALDKIHAKTSKVIGGVMKRDEARTLSKGETP